MVEQNKTTNDSVDTTEIISYFSKSIFRRNTPEDVVWDIAEKCIQNLGFTDCVIYLKNVEQGVWEQMAAYGPKNIEFRSIVQKINIPFGHGIVGSVGESGIAEIVKDTSVDSRYIVDDANRYSEMTVPIKCDNEVIGVIDSENEERDYFNEQHLLIVQSVANICGQKIGRSISERKASAYARFYEDNPSPVFRLDKLGNVSMANESTLEVFKNKVFIGKPIRIATLTKAAIDSYKEDKRRNIEIHYNNKYYFIDINPVVSKEHINIYVSDVTELHEERIRLKKAENVKSEFLSTMSHEIRTPLNAILGLNYLLLNQDLTQEEIRKHLISMEFSGKQLLNLVTDILDLERIKEGKTTLKTSVFNLVGLCELIVNSFKHQASLKSNKLSWRVKSTTPKWVCGDIGKVTQLLNNLLNNALKFTNNGLVELRVLDLNNEGLIRFTVKDSGRGISFHNLEKIFDAFEQSDDQEINVGEPGTGLGLTISRELAELHGGSLTAQSRIGVGSTFTLEVKFDIVEKPEVENPTVKADHLSKKADRPILIVDDNTLNSFVVSEMLKKWGFTTITEEDSRNVIDIWKEKKPFLMLLDLQMPHINGFELAENIRAEEQKENLDAIPLIALTADAEPSTKEKALEVGMDYVIIKPFSPAHLKLVVTRLAES